MLTTGKIHSLSNSSMNLNRHLQVHTSESYQRLLRVGREEASGILEYFIMNSINNPQLYHLHTYNEVIFIHLISFGIAWERNYSQFRLI